MLELSASAGIGKVVDGLINSFFNLTEDAMPFSQYVV